MSNNSFSLGSGQKDFKIIQEADFPDAPCNWTSQCIQGIKEKGGERDLWKHSVNLKGRMSTVLSGNQRDTADKQKGESPGLPAELWQCPELWPKGHQSLLEVGDRGNYLFISQKISSLTERPRDLLPLI